MLPIVNELLRARHWQELNQALKNKRKTLRDNFRLNELSEERFIELFRLNKELYHLIENELRPFLRQSRYRDRVSLRQKLLVALHFYATGSYQRCIGGDFNLGVSQTSVHRYVHEVTEAIDQNLSQRYIKFPSTPPEINEQKEIFMNQFNFPGIIGAVDGTHIAILKPTQEEHNFINRKGFHSINAQIVCSANLKILSINANFPGSSHDAFIWRNSRLRAFMLQLHNNGNRSTWLIGDSGYPLEPVLMTPFLNPPENSPEARYNRAQIRARNCVERCIGLLKTRFRCLLKERVARYAPQFVGQLVNACAVLHNLCIAYQVDVPEDDVQEDNNVGNPVIVDGNLLNEGRRTRDNIVRRYFNNNV